MQIIQNVTNEILLLFGGFQALQITYYAYIAWKWNNSHENEHIIIRQNKIIIQQQNKIINEITKGKK